MGGPERVERQHASGRLTVRERIERLLDPEQLPRDGRAGRPRRLRRGRRARGASCPRTRSWARAGSTAGAWRSRATTSPCAAGPPTPRSGRRRSTRSGWRSELRIPLVRLVDGTGGGGSVKSLEDMGFSYVPPLPGFDVVVRNLAIVPVVAAALGPVAGLGAARVVCSHFSVIVRGSAQLFVAGPPVVAAAMGETPDKETLGGARLQARAGAVDNVAADEEDALAQLRRFLSYLPGSVWEAPPAGGRDRPAGPARGGADLDRAARPAPALQDAPHPRRGARPRLGVRARRGVRAPGDHRRSPGSAAGRWGCSPRTPSTTAAA